jgi:ribonuclease P protein component
MERSRRLRKGAEFDGVYAKGTATSGPLVVLRVLANDEGVTRWGFAVGKRIAKKAVVRNRVRRRLREAAGAMSVCEGQDVVVTARAAAIGASFAELREALARGLRRAGVATDAAGGRRRGSER